MPKRHFYVVLFLIISILPVCKAYAQSSNVGFVSGSIWYSKDPFEEGDKIKIYTLIFNPDQKELSGKLSFFDKNILLGSKNFTVPATTAKDISINWTVIVGDHIIFAKIENAKFLLDNGQYQNVLLTEDQTENSERAVSKKVVVKTENANNVISFSIPNVSKLVEDNTPEIIAKPITATANSLENFRQNISAISENKKMAIKNEIETLNSPKKSSTVQTNQSKLLKPFKYIELFFLYFFSFIFNNRLVFYLIFVLAIFFLLRYIWRLIF